MNWNGFAGNRTLKRRLDSQMAGGGLHHAYIIAGAAGSGRHTLAQILASAMVCTAPDGKPCGVCRQCRKAAAGVHPDITTVSIPEGKQSIPVEAIRKIREQAAVLPNEGAARVFLIEEAQTMNASAQNALLKILEEGPPYLAFLLLAEGVDTLLPTVQSRCEILNLEPVTGEEAEAYLRERFPEAGPEAVRDAVAAAEGNLGRAAAVLGGEDDGSARELAGQVAATIPENREFERMKLLRGIEGWDRPQLERFLDSMLEEIIALAAEPSADEAARREYSAMASEVQDMRRALYLYFKGPAISGWLCAALTRRGR